jgi:GGDEF domain-containing protein
MSLRDSGYNYSLISININKETEIDDIIELSESLKKVVRTTDLITRVGTGIIWILLPSTLKKDGEILASKLRKLDEHSNIFIVSLFSSNELENFTNAEEYLKYLTVRV